MKKYKIKEAAAIKYNKEDNAPTVIAKGKRNIAEQIIKNAKEKNVPVYEDPELAHTLNMIEIGQQIPPELYDIVAQILIFVGDVDQLQNQYMGD